MSRGSHCCRLHRRREEPAHLPRGQPLPAWGEMSQGYKASSPGLPPTPNSTHGGRVAVPTQLRRVLGRQQVPAGLSWPGLGSGEAMGWKNGSAGQSGDSYLNHGQPGPFKEAKGQGGWGLGLLSSPHSCLGAGIGTRFSCSVPTKPLQKLGGSERRRATTWAERGVGRGHWQCPEYTPHLRDPSPCTAVACPP